LDGIWNLDEYDEDLLTALPRAARWPNTCVPAASSLSQSDVTLGQSTAPK
jgi:hypothetical protein